MRMDTLTIGDGNPVCATVLEQHARTLRLRSSIECESVSDIRQSTLR